ncbi:MAG: TonB family protein [Acidobacteriota bacterium]
MLVSASAAQVRESKSAPVAEDEVHKASDALEREAINKPQPQYPPIAKAARASGQVKVEVAIDEAGKVISTKVLSGHPLLRAAALTAARQWEFKPTLLSGKPVKVIGVLTFNFVLQDGTDSPAAKREPKSDPAEELCEQAYELGKEGRHDEAIEKYLASLRLKPDYAWAHYNLGMAYLSTRNPNGALKSCEQALNLRTEELKKDGDGERDMIYENSNVCLGLAKSYLGRYDEAIIHLRKVSELEKQMADVRVFLGTVLIVKGDYEAAIVALKESVAIKPSSAALFSLGDAYLKLNRFKEAIESYKQCIELEDGPFGPPSHYGLGIAYLRLGDKQSAMNEYHALKKMNGHARAELLLNEINK